MRPQVLMLHLLVPDQVSFVFLWFSSPLLFCFLCIKMYLCYLCLQVVELGQGEEDQKDPYTHQFGL